MKNRIHKVTDSGAFILRNSKSKLAEQGRQLFLLSQLSFEAADFETLKHFRGRFVL